MIERWPEAVIFDMDGLMLDTEAPALRAWESAARAQGREFDLELCRQMIGRNFGDCVALIRARHGSDYPVDQLTSAWAADYDALVAADQRSEAMQQSDPIELGARTFAPRRGRDRGGDAALI